MKSYSINYRIALLCFFQAAIPSFIPSFAECKDFLTGGDISMLTRIEELNGRFLEDGEEKGFLQIMKGSGWNCGRLRLFVNPNHRNAVINDLEYTLALGKRIKDAGYKLLLNFHYSDTWADPGHQSKPKEWEDLSFEELETKVEEYTAEVIEAFKEQGALPDIVQVGNEITPGMLWSDGRVGGQYDSNKQWDQFTRLLKAGVRGVQKPLADNESVQVMLHIDKGGDASATRWFFDNINKYDVSYDLIGLSFYPWWHGSMNDLRNTLRQTALRYDKDIVVVETAYPHRNTQKWERESNMSWAVSPEGQYNFLKELLEAVQATPNERGIGVIYWYPESIPVNGLFIWNGGEMALFDSNGNALPSVKAFRQESKIESGLHNN